MTGSDGQIEWAEQIRPRVNAEFDRVAAAFAKVAAGQTGLDQSDTHEIIALLEKHRAEVMAHTEAGYFIKQWQELSDQVRKLLSDDPEYQAIRGRRTSRRDTRARTGA